MPTAVSVVPGSSTHTLTVENGSRVRWWRASTRRKFVACSAGRLLLSQISFDLEAGRVGGDEDGGEK